MDKSIRHELSPDVPDRFYLNEMKREIGEQALVNPAAELYAASETVDIVALKQLIIGSVGMEPNQFVSHGNSNPPLRDELWRYLDGSYRETLTRRNFGPHDFRGKAVALSSACARLAVVVDRAKVEVLGRDTDTNFTNSFTSGLIMAAAKALVERSTEDALPGTGSFVVKLTDEAFNKTAIEKGNASWIWSKAYSFAESLSGFVTAHEILTGLPSLDASDTETLRRHNQELGDASKALRTYTPKPAIGELAGSKVQTLFVDSDVHSHVIITESQRSVVKLFPNADLTSSNVSLVQKQAYKNEGGTSRRIVAEGAPGQANYCDVVIVDGQSLTLGGLYLDDFAKNVGAESQAVVLSSMLLGQNFDLTVPTYVVDMVNEEADRLPRQENSTPEADLLRRLMIARTRVMNVLGKDIHDELEKETNESLDEHRDIPMHGVVGHLRKLPAGFQPSQAARDLCMEQLGVEIPEGQTYVQEHERGNIPVPNRGHKIVQRDIGRLGVAIKHG